MPAATTLAIVIAREYKRDVDNCVPQEGHVNVAPNLTTGHVRLEAHMGQLDVETTTTS